MKARRWIEKTLLLAGIIGLGVWTWSRVSSAIFQDWQSWSFDREMRGQSAAITEYLVEKEGRIAAVVRTWLSPIPEPPVPTLPTPARPRSIRNHSVVGRLAIPRLHLSAMVREGTGESTLTVALGHIPGTALPGEKGNVGVAGHRDTLFRSLREIRENDLIRFETFSGNHSYEVESTEIVSPDNVGVLKASRYPELTLVTCYPFYYVGAAPDRFIVRARLVSGSLAHGFPEMPREMTRTRDELTAEHEEPSQDAALDGGRPAGPDDAGEPSVSDPEEVRRKPAVRKVSFRVSTSHSQELASEILFGVTRTDATHRCVDGWMWVINRRRTIWLRRQRAEEPVVFYGYQDGKKRELMITRVTADSVAGYLLLPEPARVSYAPPR